MSYQPAIPPLPVPPEEPGSDKSLWPGVETALPPSDTPTALIFQRAYYAINLAAASGDPKALDDALRARDALDDAFAPFGFLAEPVPRPTGSPVTGLTFVSARLHASCSPAARHDYTDLFSTLSQDDLTDTTPLAADLVALAPQEFSG